jgi:hypothetical protein
MWFARRGADGYQAELRNRLVRPRIGVAAPHSVIEFSSPTGLIHEYELAAWKESEYWHPSRLRVGTAGSDGRLNLST